jgi:hypothetical protein
MLKEDEGKVVSLTKLFAMKAYRRHVDKVPCIVELDTRWRQVVRFTIRP